MLLNPPPSKPRLCSEPRPQAGLYVIINPCSALSTAPNYDLEEKQTEPLLCGSGRVRAGQNELGKKRGWRWIISPFSSSTFTALSLALFHLHVSEAFFNYLGSNPRSFFICHRKEAGWGERGAEKVWGLWEQRESELMVLVRGEGYQDWRSCWIHFQSCPYSDI